MDSNPIQPSVQPQLAAQIPQTIQTAPVKPNNWFINSLAIIIILLSLSAAAFFAFRYTQLKNQISQNKPIPTQSISLATNPTTNWKLYTDSKNGFSLQYPISYFPYRDPSVDFFIATSTPQGGNGPKFLGQNDAWIETDVSSGANLNSLDEYLYLPGQPAYPSDSKKTSLILDGVNGYLITYSLPISAGNIAEYREVAITLKDRKIYTIYLSAWKQEILQTNQSLFNQILSTFKYTKPSQDATNTPTLTPNYLTKTYIDTDLGYTISYNTKWEFRRTYGKDIPKLAPSDIVSGIDLHQGGISANQAVIVVNVLDSHGLTSIDQWIKQYDLNYPQVASKEYQTFNGTSAIVYRYRMTPNDEGETWYFIRGNYTYRIVVHESTTISAETRAIFQSFTAK